MEQNTTLDEINEIGALKTFKASITKDNPRKVSDLLKELKLTDRFYAILANGKRVDEDYNIDPKDDLVILPRIAGGDPSDSFTSKYSARIYSKKASLTDIIGKYASKIKSKFSKKAMYSPEDVI